MSLLERLNRLDRKVLGPARFPRYDVPTPWWVKLAAPLVLLLSLPFNVWANVAHEPWISFLGLLAMLPFVVLVGLWDRRHRLRSTTKAGSNQSG